MAMLRPFRPLRYNPALVGDLARVVAPPYDVISDAYRDTLHERSEYNVIRLILNRAADRYTAAGEVFAAWRRARVLVRDAQAALCYYVENFQLADGTACERGGVIGAVRLEPFASGTIRPHERTFARAKEDRMRILQACRANLSPIFGLYANQEHALDPARAVAAQRPADIDISDDKGERHRVWLLTDPAAITAITTALAQEAVMIADGHHRYETALAYHEMMQREGSTDPEAAHNFILMYLTSMSDRGLVILPTHRVLVNAANFNATEFTASLRRHFSVRPFPRGARDAFKAYLRESTGRFGVALSGSADLYVATLEDPSRITSYTAALAPAVRQLDVSVLDTVILRGLAGIDCTAAAQEGQLTYTHDDDSALDAVAGGAQAAFLMNPPRIEDVMAVCVAGDTMPEKSTYFFPKLLSGLVFRPLDDE